MKLLSLLTLSAMLTITSCSHFNGGKSCCAKEQTCKDGSCAKKKAANQCKEDGHCAKKDAKKS